MTGMTRDLWYEQDRDVVTCVMWAIDLTEGGGTQ